MAALGARPSPRMLQQRSAGRSETRRWRSAPDLSPHTPHPTFPAWSGASESGGIQTRPHRASNRLDGSRSESGKPARHIGAIAFILGSEALAERRLLIGNYDNVKKEPDQRAVAEEMPVSE